MEEDNKYDVYIYLKGKKYGDKEYEDFYEDIEASSEEEAIEIVQESFAYSEDEDDEDEINLSDYTFKVIKKS